MPQHYGIFYTWDSKGKLVGTQRWLLARDKRNILAWVSQEIERLVSYRETIESIPTKEEYYDCKPPELCDKDKEVWLMWYPH